MPKQQLENMIVNYKREISYELLEKCTAIRRKALIFLGYQIVAMIFFKYALFNIVTSLIFVILNIVAIFKLFAKALLEVSELSSHKNMHKKGIWLVSISSTLGYVLLYLIYKDYINIPIFEGRTPDEFAMVFILFYIPIYVFIIKCFESEIRMSRKWER